MICHLCMCNRFCISRLYTKEPHDYQKAVQEKLKLLFQTAIRHLSKTSRCMTKTNTTQSQPFAHPQCNRTWKVQGTEDANYSCIPDGENYSRWQWMGGIQRTLSWAWGLSAWQDAGWPVWQEIEEHATEGLSRLAPKLPWCQPRGFQWFSANAQSVVGRGFGGGVRGPNHFWRPAWAANVNPFTPVTLWTCASITTDNWNVCKQDSNCKTCWSSELIWASYRSHECHRESGIQGLWLLGNNEQQRQKYSTCAKSHPRNHTLLCQSEICRRSPKSQSFHIRERAWVSAPLDSLKTVLQCRNNISQFPPVKQTMRGVSLHTIMSKNQPAWCISLPFVIFLQEVTSRCTFCSLPVKFTMALADRAQRMCHLPVIRRSTGRWSHPGGGWSWSAVPRSAGAGAGSSETTSWSPYWSRRRWTGW